MTLLFSLIWGLAAGWLGINLLAEGNTLLAYVALAFASACGYYALSNTVAILRSLRGPEVKCAKCGATERLRDLNIRRDSKLYAVEIVRADGSEYGALVCFLCEHWTELLREADGSYQHSGFAPVDKEIYQLAITYAEARNHNSALKKIKSSAIGRQLRKEARGQLPIRELSVISLCIGLIGLLGYFGYKSMPQTQEAPPTPGQTTTDRSSPSGYLTPLAKANDETPTILGANSSRPCGVESETWHHCFGRYEWNENHVFEGLWIDGNPFRGLSTWTFDGGRSNSYEGQFVVVNNELRYHGRAIYTFGNGQQRPILCDHASALDECDWLID